MKTFKGRARGWFYADQLCRDIEKENLDSSLRDVGRAGVWADQSGWRPGDSSQGQSKRDEWGMYVGQRAETHEEGSQHQWVSQPFCALVSPFVIWTPAWVS